jgi:hypothetical protein
MWWVSHLLGSDASLNLWKDLEDPGGAYLSPSYTSDKQFRKSCLLAIIGSPWHMTLTPTNEAISHETAWKVRPLPSRQNKLTDLLGCYVIGVRIDFYQKAKDC